MSQALTDGTHYYRLFSTAEAIDFALTDGVDAYVVPRKRLGYGATQSVTLTRIAQAPANTGLLVRTAEARSYTLAQATADVATPEKNALVAVAAPTDAADLFVLNGENALVIDRYPALLANDGEGRIGFSKVEVSKELKKVDGRNTLVFGRDEVVLGGGTAYMVVDDEAGEVISTNAVVPLVLLDEPEPVPTAETILDAKNLVDHADDSDDVIVHFHDALVTAVSPGVDGQGDAVVVEDATAAMRLFRVGLADRLKAGDVLNGSVQLYLDYSPFGGSALIGGDKTDETFATLTITEGTVTPMAVGDDNLEEYIFNYDWRLVRFTGNNKVVASSHEGEYEIYLDILGDQVPIFDLLQLGVPIPDDGSQQVEVVGYLFDLLGNYYLQPLDFIVDGMSLGIDSPRTAAQPSPATAHPSPAYDLSGRRLSGGSRLQVPGSKFQAPRSSLKVQNGRKVIQK